MLRNVLRISVSPLLVGRSCCAVTQGIALSKLPQTLVLVQQVGEEIRHE